MTRAEAIRILDPETTGEALAEIEYYNGFSGKTAAVQAVSDACEVAIEAIREQEQRRWIPVTDRLPEESGDYIVYYYNTASNKPLISMRHFYGETPEAFLHNKAMTHWMPLPEPPKEDA